MSVKMTEKELYNLRDYTINQCMTLFEMMEDYETHINTFVSSTSLTGATADNIKKYFSETHISVLNMLKTYIKDYMFKSVIYYQNLTQIDSKVNAIVDTEVLAKCTADFATLKGGFSDLLSSFGEISRGVNDVIDLYHNYTYRGGEISNCVLRQSFDYASVDVEALKIYFEEFDVLEMPFKVEPMQKNRAVIKNLIAELRDKQLNQITEYEAGDLYKCESYFEANQLCEETKEFVDQLDVHTFSEQIGSDKGEYQMRKLGLVVGAAHSTYEAIKNAVDAAKDISIGVGLCVAYNPVTGVAMIVKGGKEAFDSVDSLYGAAMYTYAFATDDVYYDHTSISDYVGGFIISEVLDGNGDIYNGAGTVTSTAISLVETYYTSESPEWAVTYVAYNYFADEVVLPQVEQYVGNEMSEMMGFDISETGWSSIPGTVVNELGSGKLDNLNEEMTFNELK